MIEALLAKLELRSPLSPEERRALADSFGPPKTFQARETMVAQGSSPQESTVLLTGMSGRLTVLQDGGQQITACHIAGDFVDLHSFLMPVMDHAIVALSDCTAASVPHVRLRELTDRFPHLTRLLWLSTLIDAANHRQRIVGMGRLSALQHLAHLFCELCDRLNVVGLAPDCEFDLPLSQTMLADALGLTPVHINRTLQELRGRGLVRLAAHRLKILDRPALAELAEYDSTYLQLRAVSA